MLTRDLPFPPSKNALDQQRRMVSKAGKRYTGRAFTKEYLQFKADVYRQVRMQRGPGAPMILGDVAVTIEVYPPDARRRDLFNALESLSDALTAAKVWRDDSQIKRGVIEWGPQTPTGGCRISIQGINDLFPSTGAS